MRTEVLVIGGGAAGVEVAAALRRHAPDREVTVVTSGAELLYRPWLVYLPAGKLDGQALRIPMAQVARMHGFAFQQDQGAHRAAGRAPGGARQRAGERQP